LKILQRFSALTFAFFLCLNVLFGYPSNATAGKGNKSITFDPSTKAINVANIYETNPTTQEDIVSDVSKFSKSALKKAPGFSSFSVLKSEDGLRVLTLTQWQNPESYQAFVAQPPVESVKFSKTDKEETAAIAPTRTVTLTIDKIQAPEGIIPALSGKKTLVQFDEMAIKATEDKPKLIDSMEKFLPSLTQTYPAPRSAVLFQSQDTANVALLANWGYTSSEFADLSKVPTINSLSDEVAPLVSSDRHLYEVVKVIAAKPEKDKKEQKFKKESEE
jgi:heme-degrading monooxygenase HmoA